MPGANPESTYCSDAGCDLFCSLSPPYQFRQEIDLPISAAIFPFEGCINHFDGCRSTHSIASKKMLFEMGARWMDTVAAVRVATALIDRRDCVSKEKEGDERAIRRAAFPINEPAPCQRIFDRRNAVQTKRNAFQSFIASSETRLAATC